MPVPKTLVLDSPLGALRARFSPDALESLGFEDAPAPESAPPDESAPAPPRPTIPASGLASLLRQQLDAYFNGHTAVLSVPLAPRGTPFQQQVWSALQTIPPGQTRSYAHVARLIGRPTATRAVARANATNPIAILIPCHRVIGSDGTLTGYGGGLDRKRWLLDHERLRLAPSLGNHAPDSLFAHASREPVAHRP